MQPETIGRGCPPKILIKKDRLEAVMPKKAIDPTAANWKPQVQFSAKRSSKLT